MTWPDGGTTPFRGEKATNWEGGFRVPMLHPLARRHQARHDLQRDLLALGLDPDLLRRRRASRTSWPKCLKGYQASGKTFKVHLDGYNLMPFFKGEAKESPRKEFLYWNDDGELWPSASRTGRSVFKEQRATRASASGGASSPICAHPSSSICGRIPSSAATKSIEYEQMVRRPLLRGRPRAGDRRAVARELQGVPDPAEARELQPRRRDGEAGAEELNALLKKDPAASSAAGSCPSGPRKGFAVSFHTSGRGSRPVKGRGGRTRWPRRARRPRRAGTCRPDHRDIPTYRPRDGEHAESVDARARCPSKSPHVRWAQMPSSLGHARSIKGQAGSRFGRPAPV